MNDKEILLEIARCLDIRLVKDKYRLGDQKIKKILTEAASALPETEPERMSPELPEITGKRDFVIYTDGASRGNPGPAALGILIKDRLDEEVLRVGKTLGRMTNNQAEYQALIQALKLARDLTAEKVLIKSDSELMVKQMTGQYKVRNAKMLPLYKEAKQLSAGLKAFRITHIPRNENKIADLIANEALDQKTS